MNSQKADLVKDFVRSHGGFTRRQIACGLKGKACYATVSNHVTLGRIEGVFEEKKGQIWLTEKGHKQLLLHDQKTDTQSQDASTATEREPDRQKPGNTWRFLQQFRVVDLRVVVREEDLNVASLLADIRDFPEVVDAKTIGVTEVPVEDIVITLKFKK